MAGITVENAVAKDNLVIPLIDFAPFLSGDAARKKQTAQAILNGFRDAGFIYLKNHGISSDVVSSVFSHSAKFFSRPQEQKDSLSWYSPEANRGYSTMGREKVTDLQEKGDVGKLREAIPDLKESFEIGKEGEPGMPNMWLPTNGDEDAKAFKEVMLQFHDTCKNMHMELMRAIALGMGIDERWFDSFTDGGDNTLRLLHYPGVSKSAFNKRPDGQFQVRAGEHSDYGSITLLFQDSRGGLQVRSPKGTFVDATPIPDTIVVNAGDLLARWSNDTIKSTKHRVVEPPPNPENDDLDSYPPRYSVAYFCNPNFERIIEAIPGTYEEKGKKYEGIKSGEYLINRLTATY